MTANVPRAPVEKNENENTNKQVAKKGVHKDI